MKWKIGNVEIPNRFVLAPMAGVTDLAFRRLCKEQGAGLLCMEMISAKALLKEIVRLFVIHIQNQVSVFQKLQRENASDILGKKNAHDLQFLLHMVWQRIKIFIKIIFLFISTCPTQHNFIFIHTLKRNEIFASHTLSVAL